MNDELAAIAGKHEQLVGILQEKYGVAKEEARQQIDEFKKIVGMLKKSNANLLKMKRVRAAKQKQKRSAASQKSRMSSRKRRS